jgi:NADPH-dependent 2,4-dienoyl-CoA reductase/sulfur reductase-like enzyme
MCINRLYLGLDSLCIQNPATGREETIPHLTPRSSGPRRRVVVVGAGPAGLEAARVAAERGHSVVLLEAAAQPGGQVVLAARATARRADLIGIVDWLASECRHGGVDLRYGVVADAAAVLALQPEVVIVATGGQPRLPVLTEGSDLVVSTWDVISGAATPRGSVLIFDDHGTEDALSCAERMAAAGSTVEIATPDHRLTAVRRTADRRLEADLWNDYTRSTSHRVVDQVVVEHGSLPNDELYFELREGSCNGGELDLDAFIAGRPQERMVDPAGTYRLFRVGDAVASRSIHSAIYEARRIALPL